MDEKLSQPCSRCSLALGSQPEHPRCPSRSCGCVCRDSPVDLQYPDVRLRVAQICQAALGSPFLAEQSPEAAYVNGRLQDVLWEELEDMMGLSRPALALEVEFTPHQVEQLRQVADTNWLTEEELTIVRQLLVEPRPLRALSALAEPGRALPTRRMPAPPPPPDDDMPEPPDLPDSELEPEPEPPPQRRKGPRAVRGSRTDQAMPTGNAMTMVTAVQAGTAHQIGERAFETVRNRGGATGGLKESNGR